jgi:hypothetical protein
MCDIVERCEATDTQPRNVVRRLISKRPDKDAPLLERVVWLENAISNDDNATRNKCNVDHANARHTNDQSSIDQSSIDQSSIDQSSVDQASNSQQLSKSQQPNNKATNSRDQIHNAIEQPSNGHDQRRHNSEHVVRFEPLLLPNQTLPFYYPHVARYEFVHTTLHGAGDDGQDAFTISVRTQKAATSTTSINADQQHERAQKHLDALLQRLMKWGRSTANGYRKLSTFDTLFTKEMFQQTYASLKAKYGFWVKQWPEKTDPQKFVFEELAIAAYLLCLWPSPQRFVDLGCGNGFLTFVLTQEGHPGFGIDQVYLLIKASYKKAINMIKQISRKNRDR